MEEEWKSCRIVHSIGGIRLINEYGPPVRIIPNVINGDVATFKTPSYGSLFAMSNKLGLSVLGVEFLIHTDQFEGKDIPEWRSYYKSNKTGWLNEDCARLWSNIATGAHKVKNGRLWDVGGRISHQLRVCSWRLKELSDSYHSQLLSIADDSFFSSHTKFMNGYTWLCYIAMQSFLVDICILRDYLSEYSAKFVFARPNNKKNLNITTLSGLKKHILCNVDNRDLSRQS